MSVHTPLDENRKTIEAKVNEGAWGVGALQNDSALDRLYHYVDIFKEVDDMLNNRFIECKYDVGNDYMVLGAALVYYSLHGPDYDIFGDRDNSMEELRRTSEVNLSYLLDAAIEAVKKVISNESKYNNWNLDVQQERREYLELLLSKLQDYK